MEAVPRLPMISFELREVGDRVDISRKLKQFIKNHYNESPDLYADDFKRLESIRSAGVRPTKDIQGCVAMKRYYCHLHSLSGRFPMMKDGAAAAKFTWKLLNNNGSLSISDVSFEMSVLLYNIGALHSHLGAAVNRTSADGMKIACTHFQCASWAFHHLCEEYASSTGLDFTLDYLTLVDYISMGQAQECILEKSMMDNRKPNIIAKVTVQTIEYYKKAFKILDDDNDDFIISDIIGSRLSRRWERYLRFKIFYLGSIVLLYQGQHSEEQQKMGERVAFYQAAFDKLEDARKISRALENSDEVADALTFVRDVIENKRKAAKNENEFIYHEQVPDQSLLQTVKGASLVKGIPFSIDDPELSTPELFSKLVPLNVHEAASVYSEEKAKLMRKVINMVEEKDEELDKFLGSLQLEDVTRVNKTTVPQELIDRCCNYQAKVNPCSTITDNISFLSETFHEVEAMLVEIKRLLREEECREQEYQYKVGKRPPTIVATDMAREAKKYDEAHLKAAESNNHLKRIYLKHLPFLRMLSKPMRDILEDLPPVEETPEAENASKDMQHLLDKVQEMRQQRVMFTEKLREAIRQDDIVKKLVKRKAKETQAIIDKELEKYQPLMTLIEQNLAAQSNIIDAIKDVYARYAPHRKETLARQRKRDGIITGLVAAHDAYDDLLAMSTKGVDFYKKLHVNVGKLMLRLRGTCVVQSEERLQILENLRASENGQADLSPSSTSNDYLEVRKDFGRLSLGNNAKNPYLKQCEDALRQTYFPELKSGEENNENFLLALYPVRDQSINNVQQTANNENNGNYSASQNPTTADAGNPTESTPQTVPQDTYPISAYSSVMTNSSTTGYTGPKSNYYSTENSPSRYVNPPHFYTDQNQPVVSSPGTGELPGNTSYAQENPVAENDPSASSAYGSVGYSHPSQPHTSHYGVLAYTTVPPAFVSNAMQSGNYQSDTSNDNKTPVQGPEIPYRTFYMDDFDRLSVCQHDYTSYADQIKKGNYAHLPGLPDMRKVSTPSEPQPSTYSAQSVPGNYGISNGQPASNYYAQPYGNVSVMQNQYPSASDNFASQQYQIQDIPNYEFTWPGYYRPSGNRNISMPYINLNISGSVVPAVDPNANVSMPEAVNPSQSFQSGNESVYTACQTNNYALTNSEVYKNVDYQNQTVYPNQYYVNQYGSSNGQNQYGVNYGNSATYIQAGADNQQATTTTTYSSNDSKSSPISEHSNVDLLAGLDFDIGQSPLVPETPKESDKVAVDAKMEIESQENKNEQVQETSDVMKEAEKPVTNDNCIDLEKLSQEVERYEKFVENLTLKTLNGPTCLDIKWHDLCDIQERVNQVHIVSVARCYPMKNRFPDILPYDDSRIELPWTKDDYINASLVKGLSTEVPNFILTQSPLPSTYSDFWRMVFEYQVEVIVCLLSDAELGSQIYFPKEKGQELAFGKVQVALQSTNVKPDYQIRIMSVTAVDTRVTRVVVHLQYTSWPGSLFPESPGPFLTFINECLNFFDQQRSLFHPAVVHCIPGVGRSGLFALIVVAIQEIKCGKGIPDLVAIAGQMCHFRKLPLRDREHLKFAYQAMLYYCQDLLMKRGFLTNSSAFDDGKIKEGKCHTPHPSQEFLFGQQPSSFSQMQSSFKESGFETSQKKSEEETGADTSQSACGKEDSLTNSCTSSGKTSPSNLSSDPLLSLDPANFNIKMDDKKGKKNAKQRYSTESFAKKSSTNLECYDTESEDPLSRLDPLWNLKK